MESSDASISIIIPTLNEVTHIGKLLDYLLKNSNSRYIRELLVVDGGSQDGTILEAEASGARVVRSMPGRALQMNKGAQEASGEVLYFLHADTYPPPGFEVAILEAVTHGCEAGCFRMQFDSKSRLLKFFSWFTRFNYPLCRGGDQSLFITDDCFLKSNGFNETYHIYEDNEFTTRLYKITCFVVLADKVTTSARRYRQKSTLALQFHFTVMHLKNFLGVGPEALYQYYCRYIAI